MFRSVLARFCLGRLRVCVTAQRQEPLCRAPLRREQGRPVAGGRDAGGLCWGLQGGSLIQSVFLRHRHAGGSWTNVPVSHLDVLKSEWRGLPAGPELV